MDQLNDQAQWNCPTNEKLAYQRDAQRAASSKSDLTRWRSTGSIQSACENVHASHALTFWQIAHHLDPGATEGKLERWRELDSALGPPESSRSPSVFWLTPTFCRYLVRGIELVRLYGLTPQHHVVEIGGGWGALCAVVCTLVPGVQYSILDLPVLQQAQGAALSLMGIEGTRFPSSLPAGDLLVSDYAWSELTTDAQHGYGREFWKLPAGALMCPSHHGQGRSHIPKSLTRWLGDYCGRPVLWGPRDRHYLDLAWKFGDHPRMLDSYRWGPLCH